jgi:hypothetical protein
MKHDQITAALAVFNSKPDDAGVSIPVACAFLDRSPASIWRDIAAGRLKSFSIGRSRKITVGSLRRCISGVVNHE